jgi:Cu(I)/Ag(I) efflux system membrane fusion protein
MSKTCATGILLSLIVSVAWLGGCGSPAAPTTGTQSGGEHGRHTTDHPGLAAEIEAALAELTPEDRALAEKQKVCPISGDPLGSMGAPIKINVQGHDVFVCCEGCKDPVLQEPENYLEKLGIKDAARRE